MLYRDSFLETLKTNFAYITETRKHHVIRCVFCGDSSKSPNKGHLNISKEKPVFRCVRCGESGGIYKLFTKVSNTPHILFSKSVDISSEKNTYVDPGVEIDGDARKYKYFLQTSDERKESYLVSRIGDVSAEDIRKYRIIYDADVFFSENHIYLRRKKGIDPGGISFSMTLGRKMTTRSIVKKDFDICVLYNGVDFYGVLENDITNRGVHTVAVSEGVFDVINLNKVFGKRYDVYVASLNKNYRNSVMNVIKYYGILVCDLHLFIHNDVEKNDFWKTFHSCKNFVRTFYVHMSGTGKDYGDYAFLSDRKVTTVLVKKGNIFWGVEK